MLLKDKEERKKEGFSIFGLFDRTSSLPGRARLHHWMLNPFCDKERILFRQNGMVWYSFSSITKE